MRKRSPNTTLKRPRPYLKYSHPHSHPHPPLYPHITHTSSHNHSTPLRTRFLTLPFTLRITSLKLSGSGYSRLKYCPYSRPGTANKGLVSLLCIYVGFSLDSAIDRCAVGSSRGPDIDRCAVEFTTAVDRCAVGSSRDPDIDRCAVGSSPNSDIDRCAVDVPAAINSYRGIPLRLLLGDRDAVDTTPVVEGAVDPSPSSITRTGHGPK